MKGRHEVKFGRYLVPIGTQKFFLPIPGTQQYPTPEVFSIPGTQRYPTSEIFPVPSGTQDFEILMGTGRMPTPGHNPDLKSQKMVFL